MSPSLCHSSKASALAKPCDRFHSDIHLFIGAEMEPAPPPQLVSAVASAEAATAIAYPELV